MLTRIAALLLAQVLSKKTSVGSGPTRSFAVSSTPVDVVDVHDVSLQTVYGRACAAGVRIDRNLRLRFRPCECGRC